MIGGVRLENGRERGVTDDEGRGRQNVHFVLKILHIIETKMSNSK